MTLMKELTFRYDKITRIREPKIDYLYESVLVFLSHRFSGVVRVAPAVIQKPVVKKISDKLVSFQDGTEEKINAIVYCTGYKYDYPFLSEDCRIQCDGESVKYLYKHIINVEHPTMGFLGICHQICPFPVCDIQAQFFLGSLLGRFNLKTKAEMIKEMCGSTGKLAALMLLI
ncbi:Flavin-binding monooxygenase-like [Popillia japonica]|uniref:Flavin-containing monooxygenase n=1 Tax=Popillia japonica TaxID=7064 RepID=A0AAW1JKE1_POPJA